MPEKIYRVKDENQDVPGADYRCSKCLTSGVRLWRQSHTFTVHLRLLCAVCAEHNQRKQIASYAQRNCNALVCTIGDLVPARPTPEGDNFWGHTSGDVEFWYRLPQYTNPDLETKLLRRERDYFMQAEQSQMVYELELRKRISDLRSRLGI
jgi:hypothetical protein